MKIGYDGPVRPEPFNAELRKLPPPEAVARSVQAMRNQLPIDPASQAHLAGWRGAWRGR